MSKSLLPSKILKIHIEKPITKRCSEKAFLIKILKRLPDDSISINEFQLDSYVRNDFSLITTVTIAWKINGNQCEIYYRESEVDGNFKTPERKHIFGQK